jgi:hypothetical protein
MTEAEWLAATNPRPLLEFVRASTSNRKRRLFGVACCRRLDSVLEDPQYCKALKAAERYADGRMNDTTLVRWFAKVTTVGDKHANRVASALDDHTCAAVRAVTITDKDPFQYDAYVFAAYVLGGATAPQTDWMGEDYAQAYLQGAPFLTPLLRDIVCNPFRPRPTVDAAWLDWNRGTVFKLAEAADKERSLPSGASNPAPLSLLADALEDAGCTDAELLGHLRGPGPHVRGCWALDLVLSKS